MMAFRIVYGVFMKTVKWILVLIVLIPVVIMVSFFIRNKAVGPEGWARDDVEKVLRAQMKDPDSMVIRSSYVVTRVSGAQTEISICGVVDGRNAFGGYAWDAGILLANAAPVALKKAQPGSKEFRAALRDALEATRNVAGAHGVYNMSANDHLGLDQRARVMVTIQQGTWKLAR